MISINDFCNRHGACLEGREWALANCEDMQAVWSDMRSDWLVWVATRPGVLDDRTLRKFACLSVRQVWHLLTDERSRRAVEVAERHADEQVTDADLAAASAAAWAASDAQAAWLRANAVPCFEESEK